jgi:hypothetical protein
MKPMSRNRVSLLMLLGLGVVALSGCATMKSLWPFGRAKPAPEPVQELQIAAAEGAPPVLLQFWERNTLVIDMQSVAATGQATLTRTEGNRWPARVAFRMLPNRFEVLDVRGAQRVVLPISTADTTAITVELPPGAYDEKTASLTMSWGAKGAQ